VRRALCTALAFAALASVDVAAAQERSDADAAVVAAPIEAGFAAAEVFVGPYDHVAAGTGLRNTGFGTIRLRGTPDGARKKQAFLYLGVICETAPCAAKRRANLNGAAVTLTLIATDVGTCPATVGAQMGVYRADVTAKVPAGIDADYKITGVASGTKTGSRPEIAPSGPGPWVQGATLVVIYSTPSLSPGAVYIHHGASTFAGAVLYTLPLDPVPAGTVRTYTSFGGGGQPFGAGDETWVGDELSTRYVAGPVGTGAAKKRDSDWSGDDGWYWDTHTISLDSVGPDEFIPAGVDAYVVRFVPHLDCLTAAGHVLTAR
jgi:hypothetical protein